MKLSMYMIMRRLPFGKIKCSIQDGSQNICGVRFIADSLGHYPDDYVYVAHEIQTAHSHGSNDILLIHRNNTIIISGHSLEDVLNEVLAILDYYNNWERELFKAVVSGFSIQRIVELAAPAFHGPILVTVRSGKVVGCSDTEGKYNHDELWRTVNTKGYVPPSASSSEIITEDGKAVKEWGARPQIYTMGERRIIGARIQKEGETVCSFYLQEFEQELDPADVQLSETLYDALYSIQAAPDNSEEFYTSVSLVTSLIERDSSAGLNLEYLDTVMRGEKPYQLLLIKSNRDNYDEMHRVFLVELLRNNIKPCIALSYREQALCVFSTSDNTRIEKKLHADINFHHYNIGVSNEFTDWTYLKKAYAQARLASDNTNTGMLICYFNSIVLRQMLRQLKVLDGQIGVLHPALFQLLSADRKNGTEYFKTLRTFLMEERNMSSSARKLNIHLNTMKYRMQKILELTETDLDDINIRTHLLLSFMIFEE